MKKTLFTLLATFCVISIFAQQTGQFSTTFSWTNNDGSQTRDLEVYVPDDYNENSSYSLVIGFHGQGDSQSNYMNSTNGVKIFATNSHYGNVIVACPSIGDEESWYYGDEDFGIIAAIKTKISEDYNINQNKVFAQGFSYGGKSAYLHGLEEANEIAGIIVYSPAFYGVDDLNDNCSTNNCITAHHDFNFANSSKVYVCTSAGKYYDYPTGEAWITPMASEDQTTDWQDSFLGLAMVGADKINEYAENHAVFIESTNTNHSLPPQIISEQCWDFVQQGVLTNSKNIEVDKNGFNIYPQPSNGIFNFDFTHIIPSQFSIEIYDIKGKKIKNQNINIKRGIIDLTGNSSGVYFVKIIYDNSIFTVKLILN